MSVVARDALCSIYVKITHLQITVYLAPIKCGQIRCSVICSDCYTVTYAVAI